MRITTIAYGDAQIDFGAQRPTDLTVALEDGRLITIRPDGAADILTVHGPDAETLYEAPLPVPAWVGFDPAGPAPDRTVYLPAADARVAAEIRPEHVAAAYASKHHEEESEAEKRMAYGDR